MYTIRTEARGSTLRISRLHRSRRNFARRTNRSRRQGSFTGTDRDFTKLEIELFVIVHKLFQSNANAIRWSHRWKRALGVLRRHMVRNKIRMPRLTAVEREEQAIFRSCVKEHLESKKKP